MLHSVEDAGVALREAQTTEGLCCVAFFSSIENWFQKNRLFLCLSPIVNVNTRCENGRKLFTGTVNPHNSISKIHLAGFENTIKHMEQIFLSYIFGKLECLRQENLCCRQTQ